MLIYHGEASQGPAATHVNNSIISKFKTPMLSVLGPQQVTLQRSLERERVDAKREREMKIDAASDLETREDVVLCVLCGCMWLLVVISEGHWNMCV